LKILIILPGNQFFIAGRSHILARNDFFLCTLRDIKVALITATLN
jgi:hypothetical protein